ncbi:extracellular solute-binding protein [Paenibacillus tarimensis]
MKHSKKKWSTLTALLLSLTLVLSACAGGNNGGGNTNTTESSNTGASSNAGKDEPAQEEPIEIVWANNFNSPEADGNYVQTEIEKKFNVKITNIKLERWGWKEQFSVYLASDEIPDIFPIDANETDMATWAQQGIIASLDRAEIEANMPNYAAVVNEFDPGAWQVGMIDGKNWGIPKYWPPGNDGFIPGYNKGWLENIGYSEPPKTLEEFEDVLTKFTKNDPDKNGKNDTYGMSARGKLPIQMFTSVFSAHAVNPYQFKLDAEGKVTWGAITEETRTALKLLNKWYKDGLIDPEFITNDNGQISEKFANQKIGVVDNGGWGNFNPESGYVTKPALELGQINMPGKPLIGPNGDAYAFAYGARQAPVLLGVQLEEDEKKRKKIYEILDWVATSDEGWLLTVKGQEGVSYNMVDGFPVAIEDENAAANKMGYGSFYNPLTHVDVSKQKYNISPEMIELRDQIMPGVVSLLDVLGPVHMESKSQYFANLLTLQDTYIIKAITGEANTDKDFDKFKADWLRSGGQAVLDEANKIYQERK